MIEVYLSRSGTGYYFDKSGDLIRLKEGKNTSWGKAAYVSARTLEDFMKDYQISIENRRPIKKHIGDAFIDKLKKEEMEKNKIGGRFVALVANERPDFYNLNWSGEIVEISSREINEDTGTQIPIDL
jgi:hypothetical protein